LGALFFWGKGAVFRGGGVRKVGQNATSVWNEPVGAYETSRSWGRRKMAEGHTEKLFGGKEKNKLHRLKGLAFTGKGRVKKQLAPGGSWRGMRTRLVRGVASKKPSPGKGHTKKKKKKN